VVDLALVAGDADGGALRAGQRMRAQAQAFNLVAYRRDLFFGRVRFHDYEHGKTSEVSVPCASSMV
jgi:hypothetical protein